MFLFLSLQIWFHEIFFSIWIFENLLLQILTHLIFNDFEFIILILEFLFLSYFRFLEILYFIPSSLSLLEI